MEKDRIKNNTSNSARQAVLAALFLLFPLSASLFPAAAADWPLFRGNSGRTGFTYEQAYPPLIKKWEFQVQGDVVSGPVVYGGIVYATARSGSIYALNALTGELIWDYSTDGWVDASPAVLEDRVFAAGRDSRLYAFNRLTGALLWQAELGAPSASSPLAFNGRVYAGCGAPVKKLRAFSAATGALLWEKQAAQPVESAPSTDGVYIYFGSNDGRLYAVDAVSGKDRWGTPGYSQTIGSFGPNAAAVLGGSLYALPGHDERKILRLLSSDGSLAAASSPFAKILDIYSNPRASENEVTSPVVSPYAVFAGAGSLPHTIYAFDPSSMDDLIFSSPTAGNTVSFGLVSSPAMANEVMYLGTVDARVVAVSSSGAQLQEIPVSSSAYSSPAVSNGFVYVGVMGGSIIGYKAAFITAISSPGNYGLVDGTVPVSGSLKDDSFLTGYTLDYGAGENPGGWTLVFSSPAVSEISGGPLGNWKVSDLPNGLYTLRLRATESSPSGHLAEARNVVRVNHLPQPPAGLNAADNPGDSGNKILLNWAASPSAWVTAYRVYRAPYGGGLAYLAQVSTPSLTYLDAAAATGSRFTYGVSAFDGYSESVLSGQASAVSADNNPSADIIPPAAVTGLSAAPGAAAGSVDLAWTATGDDGIVGAASGYEIRYATYSASVWASGRVWKSSRAVAGPYGTPEREAVSRLFGGVTYYLMVEAYDDGKPSYSAASSSVSAYATPDYMPPAAPSDLVVSDKPGDHGGALVLNWGLSFDDYAGARDVYGYKIFRSASSGISASGTPYAEVPAGTAVYVDTGAPENLKFYYAVAAFDSTNLSTMTAEAWGISADNWRFLDKSTGGTDRLPDGAEVSIPPDAASDSDSILIVRREKTDFFGTSASASADTGGAKPTGIIYEVKFEKTGTHLLKNAVISLPYTPAEIVSMPEESLRMYLLEGQRWTRVASSRVLPGLRKVSAEVAHFSTYSLMGYVPSGALFESEEVYTYPNPAKGDYLTFKFRVNYQAAVTIDVYDVAGEKVARLEKTVGLADAGGTSEVSWHVKNVASGVYVYRLEAKSASGTKAVTKKLAIIH